MQECRDPSNPGEERTASDVDFFRALGFLTILPCPRQESSPEDLGRSSGWFPAVGAVLGMILASAWLGLSQVFSPLLSSASVVVLWVFLTRGFHLDGLADTFDGIGGGYSRESRLTIMKDSRLGTFGGIAVAAALLLKTAALTDMTGLSGAAALFAAPVAGRWAILFAMRFFPSARPGGMGDTFRKGCTTLRLVTGTAIAVPAALFGAGTAGAVLLVLIPCAAVLLSLMMKSLLGGLTGDSYGAVCEISEILSLFLFALLQ